MPRIAPLEAPYAPEIQAAFDAIMGGREPLVLFRTVARNPHVYKKFNAGGLLDRGALTLRQREIAIDRTCALNGNAYEWGVHVAFFAERAALTQAEIAALAAKDAHAHAWPADESAIIALCDDLHATTRLSDETWSVLRASFDDAQILELIALAGFYRTVAYYCNALELPLEPYGAPLPQP